jgi:ribosomal-protein-alanine N-acetyltransferase
MIPADLPAVVAIEEASYSMPWSEGTFRTLLRRADADLLVAEIESEPVGYAVCRCAADQGELGNVAVSKEWRRRGVGAQLVEAALERARARGVREVFLEVRRSNEAARRLYARLGFIEIGLRRGYYVRPVEDAIVMGRQLPAP